MQFYLMDLWGSKDDLIKSMGSKLNPNIEKNKRVLKAVILMPTTALLMTNVVNMWYLNAFSLIN